MSHTMRDLAHVWRKPQLSIQTPPAPSTKQHSTWPLPGAALSINTVRRPWQGIRGFLTPSQGNPEMGFSFLGPSHSQHFAPGDPNSFIPAESSFSFKVTGLTCAGSDFLASWLTSSPPVSIPSVPSPGAVYASNQIKAPEPSTHNPATIGLPSVPADSS